MGRNRKSKQYRRIQLFVYTAIEILLGLAFKPALDKRRGRTNGERRKSVERRVVVEGESWEEGRRDARV